MPADMLSLPVDYLRETVAGSAAFQAWTGTASQALAKARVHAFGLDSPDSAAKPFAVVDWAPGGFVRQKEGGGTRNYMMGSGTLVLILHAAITPSTTIAEAYEFTDQVGAILSEMEELAGQAGYLDISRVTLAQGPYRPEEDEKQTRGDFYEVAFEVEFDSL